MPGWDAFLTEQDKAHLAYLGERAAEGLRQEPRVLVIDDYYSVLGLEREPILESIKTWPGSCGLEGWEAIDETVGLLEGARADSVPVDLLPRPGGLPQPVGRRGSGNRLAHLPRGDAAQGEPDRRRDRAAAGRARDQEVRAERLPGHTVHVPPQLRGHRHDHRLR